MADAPPIAELVMSSQPLDVRLVHGIEALAALREGWIALEGVNGEPDFFQSFAWCMCVAEARTRAGGGRYEALAAIGEIGGRLVAVWPLSRQRHAGSWQLRNLDDPFGQFAGVLAADRAMTAELVRRALDLVEAEKGADLAQFERVIVGSALAEALAMRGARAQAAVEAPVVELDRFASFAELRSSRNKKSMKNQRNALHRLERTGAIESVQLRGVEETASVARAAVDNRERWLDTTGVTSPAFRDAALRDIVLTADRWGLAEKRAAFELRLGGASLAQQFGYVHGNRYYAYLSGMDWSYEALAPGRLHLAMVLEAVMGDGLTAAELLTPASDYKMMWTDSARRLTDMALALTAAGRLHRAVWENGLRPAVKAVYYALPAGLRRKLLGRARGRGE